MVGDQRLRSHAAGWERGKAIFSEMRRARTDEIQLGRGGGDRLERVDGALSPRGCLVDWAHPEDALAIQRVVEVLERDAVDLVELHLALEAVDKLVGLGRRKGTKYDVHDEEEDEDARGHDEEAVARGAKGDDAEQREDDVKVGDEQRAQGNQLHHVGRDDALARGGWRRRGGWGGGVADRSAACFFSGLLLVTRSDFLRTHATDPMWK